MNLKVSSFHESVTTKEARKDWTLKVYRSLNISRPWPCICKQANLLLFQPFSFAHSDFKFALKKSTIGCERLIWWLACSKQVHMRQMCQNEIDTRRQNTMHATKHTHANGANAHRISIFNSLLLDVDPVPPNCDNRERSMITWVDTYLKLSDCILECEFFFLWGKIGSISTLFSRPNFCLWCDVKSS